MTLPAPVDRLFGRDLDIADVAARLRSRAARLLVLTGPGGVGKTRLAIASAAASASTFDDGVIFAALASVRDPALVAATIARAAGLRDLGAQPMHSRLAEAFAERDLLLVLDNFEHLLPAGRVVSELLAACPALTILMTTRTRPRLMGERDFPVQPLPLPGASPTTSQDGQPPQAPGRSDVDGDAIGQSPAVCLFVDRARAIDPAFHLSQDNALAVAEICRRVDGLPLAIELAAARTQALPPSALLERLDTRLPLLAGGPRDQPERLQTMRGAIAWSFDLLPPEIQDRFRCLAVFVGGFGLDASQAVCGASLDQITTLIDQSLALKAAADSEPRFVMLETIREFGLEQLALGDDEPRIRARHAAWRLELATAREPDLFGGPGQVSALHRLEEEWPNLRAALVWYRDRGEIEAALRLAGALGRFWWMHGRLAEGRDWLEELLAAAAGLPAEAVPPVVLAKAQTRAGSIASVQGRIQEATDRHTAALRLYEAAGDAWGIAFALQGLGVQAVLETDYARATALYEDALARFQALDDAWGIGGTLMNLGCLAGDAGDAERGEHLLTESLGPLRQAGDADRLARALVNLSEYSIDRGDAARAEQMLDEGLALLRPLGQREVIAYAQGILGLLAYRRGDTARALAELAESLSLCRDIGARHWTAQTLETLAAVLAGDDRAALAARLLGAAAFLREATGRRLPPAERDGVDATTSAARGALGEPGFAAAEAAGRAGPQATIAAAITAASELAATATAAQDLQPPRTGGARAQLTPREQEVLALLVAGQSDPQTGRTLSISPRTVESHVAAILAKLEQPSRTAAVAYAVRHDLV